jgi:excinuclease UvrABC nuclease subunit
MDAAIIEPPFLLPDLTDLPAVFLIHLREGRPYLARTARLRRRLARLLGERTTASRLLDLRELAIRVEYYLTGSRLASSLTFYHLARFHFPEDYTDLIKLRPFPFVKVLLANPFPRTSVTTRLSASRAFQYGPFRSRSSAERFEQEVLDLFQIRRCQEDLLPAPDHPGCIYGEMMKCLRPCQEVVGPEEYRSESDRLVEFLSTAGRSLLEPVASARELFSLELDFEQAQRQHARYQRIEQVLKLRDELAADADALSGVVVAPSTRPGCVELFFLLQGAWAEPVEFRVAATGREMIPLDKRLRDLLPGILPPRLTVRQRAEHLSLLARWFYSSWRDAEWIPFTAADVPYRRLVRAISRTAAGSQTALFDS